MPAEADPAHKARMLEAAYFVAGGFLEATGAEEPDPETAAYCQDLGQAWQEFGTEPASARLSLEHWHFGSTRPVNYPTRRIAALARLCAAHLHDGLFNHFVRLVNTARPRGRQRPDVAVRNALMDTFLHLEHPYWSRRYTLGGRPLSRPKALVGQERARSIVVDVLLPMLLAHAQAEGDSALIGRLHALWQGMPRRQENAVTRRMSQVMFENVEEARRVVSSARRQQGLHLLYRDSCRADGGCERCVLYLACQAGKSLAPL